MQEIMDYRQIVEDIRIRIKQTTGNFVYIGWQLKRLISTGMMQQAGYSTIEELGKAEFGLNKDDTYRFIKINTKYSVGGNSPELNEKYERIGQSKLSEMLSLPDEDLALITDKTKREDIRELNRFNKQEPEGSAQEAGSDLQNIITEFFRPAQGREAKERHTMLQKLLSVIGGETDSSIMTPEEQLQDCINPKGNATFRSGKYFLFLYEAREGMKYKIFGSDDNHHVSYLEFARTAHLLFTIVSPLKDGMDAWESFYGPELKEEPEQEKSRQEESQKEISKETSKKTPKEMQGEAPKEAVCRETAGTQAHQEQRPPVKTETSRREPIEKVVQKGEADAPESQAETGEKPQLELSTGPEENPADYGDSQESYPQKKAENAGLAPAQLEENAEDHMGAPEALCRLRKDAELYLDKILEAMEENQYFLAALKAKHLLKTLTEMCETVDEKQIDGQMEINDYIGEETDV